MNKHLNMKANSCYFFKHKLNQFFFCFFDFSEKKIIVFLWLDFFLKFLFSAIWNRLDFLGCLGGVGRIFMGFYWVFLPIFVVGNYGEITGCLLLFLRFTSTWYMRFVEQIIIIRLWTLTVWFNDFVCGNLLWSVMTQLWQKWIKILNFVGYIWIKGVVHIIRNSIFQDSWLRSVTYRI